MALLVMTEAFAGNLFVLEKLLGMIQLYFNCILYFFIQKIDYGVYLNNIPYLFRGCLVKGSNDNIENRFMLLLD